MRWEEGRKRVLESLDLLRPLAAGPEIVYAYNYLGYLEPDEEMQKAAFEEGLRHAEAIGFQLGILHSSLNLSAALSNFGLFEEAQRRLRGAQALVRAQGLSRMETWVDMHLSNVAYDAKLYDETGYWSEQGLEIARELGQRHAMSIHHHALGAVAYHAGDNATAIAHYQQSLHYAQELGNQVHILLEYGDLARTWSQQRDFPQARRAFCNALKRAPSVGDTSWGLGLLVDIAELFLFEGDAERALEHLVLPLESRVRNEEMFKIAGDLRRQLEAALSPEAYASAWERGLQRDLETTIVQLIAEFSHALGDAIAPEVAQGSAELPEPLSAREMEVLGLLAEGLSNAEIAYRLHLAVGTVKVHARSIYGKLGVNNRTQAVAQARKSNLL
jgi:ATP/maltotriose-dependent transcriptional regulator MalT